MSDTYTVKRSTIIDAPAAAVFDRINDFHNWPEWSPWEDLDPDMQKSFSGAEAGPGAEYAWSGNRKAGAGSMKIVDTTAPSKVTVALAFLKPFKSNSTIDFDLTPEGDGTKVTWTMIGPNTLMTRLMGIFKSMDKLVGPDFEKGLLRLKTVAESSDS